jgi:arylsulfatase
MKEPAIIRWPGVIPAGTICNKLSSNIDILPLAQKPLYRQIK